jgi:ferritin-like metal-binding protein YciE
MAKITSLKDLLIDEIKDLYSAENQLVKALPKMASAASDRGLKAAFKSHLAQTKIHAKRLARAAKLLGAHPKGKACHAMKGLVEEGAEAITLKADPALKDANLIGAAQRVEHYEIAAYGTARAFAQVIGAKQVEALLAATLEEEGAANTKLTGLSRDINQNAFPAFMPPELATAERRTQITIF